MAVFKGDTFSKAHPFWGIHSFNFWGVEPRPPGWLAMAKKLDSLRRAKKNIYVSLGKKVSSPIPEVLPSIYAWNYSVTRGLPFGCQLAHMQK